MEDFEGNRMEGSNNGSCLRGKAFLVYGVPSDKQGQKSITQLFRSDDRTNVEFLGNKARISVPDNVMIDDIKKKFSKCTGHELHVMPEVYKEVQVQIEDEWAKILRGCGQKFKSLVRQNNAKVLETSESLYVVGSFESVSLVLKEIEETIGTEFLTNSNQNSKKQTGFDFDADNKSQKHVCEPRSQIRSDETEIKSMSTTGHKNGKGQSENHILSDTIDHHSTAINAEEVTRSKLDHYETKDVLKDQIGLYNANRKSMTAMGAGYNVPSVTTNDDELQAMSRIQLRQHELQSTRHDHSTFNNQLALRHDLSHRSTDSPSFVLTSNFGKSQSVDGVVKVTHKINDYDKEVLEKIAYDVKGKWKVAWNFAADKNSVEISGLPEDVEKWWIMVQQEITKYKAVLSEKTQCNVVLFEEYQLDFIKTFYSEIYDYLRDRQLKKLHGNQYQLSGSPDEVNKISSWIVKHGISDLRRKVETMKTEISAEDCKDVIKTLGPLIKLCLDFSSSGKYEIVGSMSDINKFQNELEQRYRNNIKKLSQRSSPLRMDSQVMFRSLQSSNEEFEFKTPQSAILVQIARGDLIQQDTEAIVNPCNSYLEHMGGAAKAIADAAGKELLDDCRKYIRENTHLPTSEVMHTRSGKLYPRIKYVIHACGPTARAYADKHNGQSVLEKTFFNCFLCANSLHVNSVAVPAISSGSFGISKDVVALCTWKALMHFDKEISASKKRNSLKQIRLINIDSEATESLIGTFKERWHHYLSEQRRQRTTDFEQSDQLTQSCTSFGTMSCYEEKNKEDQRKTKISSSDASSPESMSKRVVPQIKGASLSHTGITEQKCCVCLKLKKASHLTMKKTCPHKCCALCTGGKCQQCTRDAKLVTGPASLQAPLAQGTGTDMKKLLNSMNQSDGKVENVRSRRRRSLSVGGSAEKVDHLETNGISCKNHSSVVSNEHQSDSNCCICMDTLKTPKKLECGHEFCKDCIEEAFFHQPKCPSCGRIFGLLTGNQPNGNMQVKMDRHLNLEGYEGHGTLIITYHIPDGIQTTDHPNPGKRYFGTYRTAYLPGNAEGEEVCCLLQKAFNAKLIFTVGKSNTTGQDNVVVWNDIRHKTSISGQYGYPDPTYLSRVRDELAAKGLKSKNVRSVSRSSVDDDGRVLMMASSKSVDKHKVAVAASSRHYDDFSSLPVTVDRASRTHGYDSNLSFLHNDRGRQSFRGNSMADSAQSRAVNGSTNKSNLRRSGSLPRATIRSYTR